MKFIDYQRGSDNDVLPNSGALIIVSKKLLDILSSICSNDFQFSVIVFGKRYYENLL